MVQPSAEQQQSSARCVEPLAISRACEVGKEFVYIYYLSANKCPQDLYRFYAASSLFIHGGRERPGQEQPPACGQSAIATRIAQLKLIDCRTKILMVDAVPDSNGEGVLIQVCGEISNNAGPMRRFMQTFILAPTGPKKYFVQRDIFRYQDEVFTDVDSTSSSDVAAAEEADPSDPIAPTQTPTPPTPPSHLLSMPPLAQPVAAAGAVSEEPPPGLAPLPAVPANGEAAAAVAAAAALSEDEQMPPLVADSAMDDEAEDEVLEHEESTVPKELPLPGPIVSGAGGVCTAAGAAPPSAVSGGVKKNFAALFGGGSAPATHAQQQLPRRAPPPPAQAPSAPVNGGATEATQQPQVQPQQPQQQPQFDQDVPDNQQLFVGNIGADMTEAELAAIFSEHGPVVACRIASGRQKQGRPVPAFGFVSFANPKSVRKLIEMKQLMLDNGEHLNLDEKKSTGGPRRVGGVGGGGVGGGGAGGGGGRGGGRGGAPRR